MQEDRSKLAVYRAGALECRKLAKMAAPQARAHYERLAIA
jgi:hypothetical protein